MVKIAALIVAGGSGERFGGDVPKQYLEVGGKPILTHSIEVFAGIADIIQVVINHEHRSLYDKKIGHALAPVYGGATRQQSVLNGLEALEGKNPDIVLIHDAARPFVEKEIIERVISVASDKWLVASKAVIPVIPVTDTIKIVENGEVKSTLPREKVFAAQTPQGFHFKTILELHLRAKSENLSFTDDSAICEHYGIVVKTVEGSDKNIKVTAKKDLSASNRSKIVL